MKIFFAVCGLLFITTLSGIGGGFGTGQKADLVLGQPNFRSSAASLSAYGATSPRGVAVDPVSHKVFVVEQGANAVYRYASADSLASGSPAEAIFGQPFFGSSAPAWGGGAYGMNSPIDVVCDSSGRLFVSDSLNFRILRFDNAATKPSGAAADGVLGQKDLNSKVGSTYGPKPDVFGLPTGLCLDSLGNLWVADQKSDRVVRYDASDLATNGAKMKFYIEPYEWAHFDRPTDVAAGPNGDIYVADSENYRVLRFPGVVQLPDLARCPPPAAVIGQKDLMGRETGSGGDLLHSAETICVDAAGTLYVCEYGRVRGFPNAAYLNGRVYASIAIGQPDLEEIWREVPTDEDSLRNPRGLFIDDAGRLWVTDGEDNRILRFLPGEVPTLSVRGKKRIKTKSSSLVLHGKFSGEPGTKVCVEIYGKKKVQWAKGNRKWTYKISLDIGVNKIQIYAIDKLGRRSPVQKVMIVRR